MQPWLFARKPVKPILLVIVGLVILVAGYGQYQTRQARIANELWWQQEYAREAIEEQAIAQREGEEQRKAAQDLERRQLLLNWYLQENTTERLDALERRGQCEQLYRSSYRNSGYSLSQVCP